MKIILRRVSMLLTAGLMATSCAVTHGGYQSAPVLLRPVDLDPIKADILVNESQKLVGESRSVYFLFFRVSGDNTFADGMYYSTDEFREESKRQTRLRTVRSAAAFKALQTGDYDFMIHPNYVMTRKSYPLIKVYRVKVTGYGAKYENFRTEPAPIPILPFWGPPAAPQPASIDNWND
jgi:hypothetical protein